MGTLGVQGWVWSDQWVPPAKGYLYSHNHVLLPRMPHPHRPKSIRSERFDPSTLKRKKVSGVDIEIKVFNPFISAIQNLCCLPARRATRGTGLRDSSSKCELYVNCVMGTSPCLRGGRSVKVRLGRRRWHGD